MKRSRYTSLVADFPESGQHLIYNWLTQSMAVVDEDLRGVFDSGVGVDTAQIPPEFVQSLEEMGFIVADEVDERQEIEEWYRQIRSHSSTCKIMVLTTYDCNFACTYCVEEGVKRPVALDGDLPERIAAWIIRRLEKLRSQRLSLNFYGGEPLLNLDGLERVAAPLLAYTQQRGIDFDGSVTTNGARLTRRNADRLRRVGVTRAKVTLDGDREAHDARRPFRGGQGSFDIIVSNLEAVGDRLTLYLGGNVDGQNRDAIPRLLDFLEARGLIGHLQVSGSGGARGVLRRGSGAEGD